MTSRCTSRRRLRRCTAAAIAFVPSREFDHDRVATTKRVVHIDDCGRERYAPFDVAKVELGGTVPPRRADAQGQRAGRRNRHLPPGGPPVHRQAGRAAQNFAAQAVIAIENARLLNELRQRTDDLTESLEQQTATAEVLSVISSSPGELEPVFQTMLENATRFATPSSASLLRDGDVFRVAAAMHGVPPAYAESVQREPFQPEAGQQA